MVGNIRLQTLASSCCQQSASMIAFDHITWSYIMVNWSQSCISLDILQLNVKIDGWTDAVCPIMYSMENGKRMTSFQPKKTKIWPNRSTRMTIWCCCMFNIKTLLMFSDLKGLLRFCTKTELLAAFLLGVLSRKEGAKSLGYLACLQLKLCPVSRHSILVGTICFL